MKKSNTERDNAWECSRFNGKVPVHGLRKPREPWAG